MEIALNTISASSSSQKTTTTPTVTPTSTALTVPSSLQKVTTAFANNHITTDNGICKNFVDQEYQTDNVNGLALLASLTLQKVLNINNINNKNAYQSSSSSSSSSTTTTTTSTSATTTLQQQQKLIHAIEYHKENILINDLKDSAALEIKSYAPAASGATSNSSGASNNVRKNGVKLRNFSANSLQSSEVNFTTSIESAAVQPKTLLKQTTASESPLVTKAITSVGAAAKSGEYTTTTRFSSALLNTSVSSITSSTVGSNTTGAISGSTISVNSGCLGKNYSKIPSDILDDLASRFIINVPDIELTNMIRICFQIELAHWFYLDFFCAVNDDGQSPLPPPLPARKLQPVGIKHFAMQLFQHIPFLRQHAATADQILDDWKNYKLSVPTYGAILVSDDLNHCLLVQSYFAKSSWGFPKGKINENEDPVHCATREVVKVYEETGYDITHSVLANDFIDAVINYQYTRLYIIRNVPMDTNFAPRTRNEIKCCDWFRIDSLPINKNDAMSKSKLGMNANSFFMIMPFVKRLKKWVNDRRSSLEVTGRRRKYSANGYGGYNSSGGGQLSPKAISPTIFNQKNGSSKKKHNNNNNASDEKQALNTSNSSGGSGSCFGSNTRSKRQRHKSMGDLDGVKLSNLQEQSDSAAISVITTSLATPTQIILGTSTVNSNNQKRNAITNKNNKVGAAANNNTNNKNNLHISNPYNATIIVGTKSTTSTITATSTTKRQLFHSQSQNDAQTNEKVVSSFDLIRKEKQQIKAASKAQKQHQQQQSERIRAKSQSDKTCTQQQQIQQQQQQQQIKNKSNVIVNVNNGKQHHQLVKVNSSNNNNNNFKNINNNVNAKKLTLTHATKHTALALTPAHSSQQQQQLTQLQIAGNIHQKSQCTPTTGLDLIAIIAAEAARKQQPQQQQQQLLQSLQQHPLNQQQQHPLNQQQQHPLNQQQQHPQYQQQQHPQHQPQQQPQYQPQQQPQYQQQQQPQYQQQQQHHQQQLHQQHHHQQQHQQQQQHHHHSEQQQQNARVQLRPRPASVSLNYSTRILSPLALSASSTSSVKESTQLLVNSSFPIARESNVDDLIGLQTICKQNLEHMASGTNLRILKRATSHQPTTATITQPGVAFQPNFNSWTNFSFNKNIMANVFVKS